MDPPLPRRHQDAPGRNARKGAARPAAGPNLTTGFGEEGPEQRRTMRATWQDDAVSSESLFGV